MSTEEVCADDGSLLLRDECHKSYIKHKGVIGIGYRKNGASIDCYFKKRSSRKGYYPEMYEPAVVGHVNSLDDCNYKSAFLRELYEELGVKIREKDITFLKEIDYEDDFENLKIGIFLFELKGEPTLNNEATEGDFYTLDDIYDLASKGCINLAPYTYPALYAFEEFIY